MAMPVAGDTNRPVSVTARRLRTPAVSRTHQCRIQIALDHCLDEFAHPIAHSSIDGIEPVVGQITRRLSGGVEESDFLVMFSMAWSPVRRTNAGRFEVDHPGDYATLNSYQPRRRDHVGR